MIYEKDPDEVLDYQVDWTDYLAGLGDAIAFSSWSVPDGLTLDSDTVVDFSAVVWLSSGTSGELYQVTNHITTTGGRTVERSIYIRVLEH